MSTDGDHWTRSILTGSHQPSTSSAGWSHPPTKIPVPSSRPREAGHASSRSSRFNPYGAPPVDSLMNTSTVAPLKRARASLPPQQPSKKPRPNDKSINPRSSDSFVRTASDQERPPFTGRPNIMPSATRSLRETPDRDLVEMLSGTPSSPEPRSGSEDPMNLKDSPYRNTNSSAVAFEARSTPLNAAKSRSNEGDGLRTQGARIESSNPPRLDMLNVRKQNRVHLMKNRNGKTSSEIQLKKRPPTQLSIFLGRDDPLSQSSMKHKQKHQAPPSKPPKPDLPVTTFDISEAFFGFEEQVESPVGRLSMLDDREAGKRLELNVRGKTFTIRKDDMAWLLCDEKNMLYISVRPESDLFRKLTHAGLLKHDSMAQAFPSRTLSLQFEGGILGTGMVPTFLYEISPFDRPPVNCSSVTAMWLRVASESRHRWQKSAQSMAFLPANNARRRASSPVTVRKPMSRRSSSDLSSPSPSPIKGKTRPVRRSLVSSRKNEVEPLPLEVTTTRQTRKRESVSNNFASRIVDQEVILIYPPTGPGGVQITHGEHHRLLPGEFLNDTLIEFGLRFWLDGLKESNPSLAEEIHVFSPFFYKKLKHKDIETGYNAVRKWTSKVDIFKKRYLVVPINERLHWYLAIIMYPEHILRLPPPASNQEPNSRIKLRAQDRLASPEVIVESPHISDPSPTPSRVASPPGLTPESREVEMALISPQKFDEQMDKMAESAGPMEPESPKAPTPSSPGVPDEEILMPDYESIASVPNEEWKTSQDSTWLLSFDSLGTKHPSVFIALRKYLALEAKHKKGIDVGELPKTQQAKVPSPVQPNYCDCGVYLIQTTETFLGRADDFFRQLMNDNDPLTPTHSLWEASSYGAKRQQLFDTIQALSNEWRVGKGLPPTAAPEPILTQSQTSVVELVEELEQAPAPPIPHQESSDDDSIQITGEVRGKGRLTLSKAAKLAARRRK